MQTFLPLASFEKSAKVLDNKRLGKQRVEAYQILKTLAKGPYKGINKLSDFKNITEAIMTIDGPLLKTPWYNHPAVQMWKGYEKALIYYGMCICEEWTDRGFKDSMTEKFDSEGMRLNSDSGIVIFNYPDWLGNEQFHASHRSNLLRKDQVHYGKFGWTEPNNLPYYWPTKEK